MSSFDILVKDLRDLGLKNGDTVIIKRTETARADFRKNPTVENGYKLLAAIEGKA